MIEIVLAGKPRGKERVRVTREGHAYTPSKTVEFEGRLAYAAAAVMAGRPPCEGPLRLEILSVLPIPESWPKKKRAAALEGSLFPTGKPDWDNLGKTVDALNFIVWRDDAQICDGRVLKEYGAAPMMRVRVWPMDMKEGFFT